METQHPHATSLHPYFTPRNWRETGAGAGISEEEAQAEGVAPSTKQIVKFGRGMFIVFARQNFARLWDSLYSARGLGWDANPWVWAATFRRISKEEALNG